MINLEKYRATWLSESGKLAQESYGELHYTQDEICRLLAIIDANMESYAVHCQRNAEMLEECGIYKRIAGFVKPTVAYADLGCGSGELIATVGFPNALGIDINHHSLALAEKKLSPAGVRSFASSNISWEGDTGFVIIPSDGGTYPLLERGKINLLQDDIRAVWPKRSLELARRHIREIGIPDYITFTIPGGSAHTIGEKFYPDLSIVIDCARQTAGEMLPHGCHYVESQRLEKTPDALNILLKDFREKFGYTFEVEEAELFDMPPEMTNERFYINSPDNPSMPANSDVKKDLAIIKSRKRFYAN